MTKKKKTTKKRKHNPPKIDKSIVIAGVVGIILAIALIIYYTFFDY